MGKFAHHATTSRTRLTRNVWKHAVSSSESTSTVCLRLSGRLNPDLCRLVWTQILHLLVLLCLIVNSLWAVLFHKLNITSLLVFLWNLDMYFLLPSFCFHVSFITCKETSYKGDKAGRELVPWSKILQSFLMIDMETVTWSLANYPGWRSFTPHDTGPIRIIGFNSPYSPIKKTFHWQ